jgi:sterol desaturase/sphingolipid hydroxylase (fatty acid hydroxylase superfamily)
MRGGGAAFDGFHPFNLEALWPGISPLGAFFVYFVVLDFFDYWYHRASHKFNWWWGCTACTTASRT